MTRKVALIIISIILMTTFAYAHPETECAKPPAPPEPERIDFAGGQYYTVLDAEGEETNALVILPKKPMLTDRFARYGNINVDPKTGQRGANTKTKNKLTPEAQEIYDLLDRMKDKDGFFHVLFSVIVQYDSVTLVKYDRIEFADYIKQILKAFE